MILPDFVATLVGLCVWMALGWFVAERSRRTSLIDAFWAFGVGGAGAFLALAPLEKGDAATPRELLVALLVALWGGRLGVHVVLRTWRRGEDPRFGQMKREWGRRGASALFWYSQLQAATVALLAASVFAAARNPRGDLDWRDWAALALVAVGILGASVADQQLAAFTSRPGNGGRVCEEGLWAWSRHPNYFFAVLCWLAFPLIGVEPGTGYPWGWAALIGPCLLYWLVRYATGIPPLEDYMLRSRGQAFQDYRERVSAFVPLPPRKRPRP